jgi:hypothetical protein
MRLQDARLFFDAEHVRSVVHSPRSGFSLPQRLYVSTTAPHGEVSSKEGAVIVSTWNAHRGHHCIVRSYVAGSGGDPPASSPASSQKDKLQLEHELFFWQTIIS